MAIAWLAYETTTTTGTGTYSLAGALNSAYTTFGAVLANLDPVWFLVHGDGENFEVNNGVYNATPNTLTRGVVFSTNSNNPVNWASGTKAIYAIEPVFDPSDFLRAANNLGDLQSVPTARTNLGLTAMATADPENFNLVLKFGTSGRLVLPVGLSLWAT